MLHQNTRKVSSRPGILAVIKILDKAFAPTALVTFIFFLNYYLFGMEHTIIGPFLTMSFLKFRDMEKYYGCMVKSFGIYAVMAVLAALALLHPLATVVVNALALFWIGYFLIDEYNPLNYFPAGMALIFFQISPVSGTGLFKRILALFVSFTVMMLFLEGMRIHKGGRSSKVMSLAGEGIGTGRRLTEYLKNEERESAGLLCLELCRINRKLSLAIYEANRSFLTKCVKANRCTRFIACFQIINYLAQEILDSEPGEGLERIEEMNRLLDEYEEFYNTGMPRGTEQKYKFRENPMDIRSFRLRFALRQVIVMTPCLLYGSLCPWENGYWLAISVFFMMIPVYEQTFSRVSQRIAGSFFGILACLLAFFVFQDSRVLMMTIANFFIYCSNSYTSTVACITCSALALNIGTDSYGIMLAMRMTYTLAGAAVAVTANMWVFRIRAFLQCSYVMELLEDLRKNIGQASELSGEDRSHLLEQYAVKSYLLASRMEEFNASSAPGHQREDVEQFLKDYMMSTAEILLKCFNHGRA